MKTLSTKRALFASVLSFLLCVTMLVGSTFAWFTDTATASVNTITAGTLDVSLEMLDNDDKWVSAEGKALQFLVDGKIPEEGTEILWEPGCTYSLPKLRVTNDGNLALKYKVALTGIKGDAELNDVIDWTIDGIDLGVTKSLAPKASAEFTITGHMQETAGNAYMGKTIDGISLTVYATQDTAEKDSTGDTYDKDAKYAEVIAAGKSFTGTQILDAGIIATNPNAVAVKAIGNEADVTVTDGYFDGGKGGNNICVAALEGAKVTIKDGSFTVGGDADGYGNSVVYSVGGHVTIEGGFYYTPCSYQGRYYVLNQSNGNPGTITVKGGTFVNYDPSTGDDYLGGNFVADGYIVLSETKENGDVWYTVVAGASVSTSDEFADAVKNGGNVVLKEDMTLSTALEIPAGKDVTMYLNGKTVTASKNFVTVNAGAKLTVTGGTVDSRRYVFSVNGGEVVVDGGNYTAQETVCALFGGSTLTVNDGVFTSKDNCVVATNGSSDQEGCDITINGGVFNANITTADYIACGVYVANKDTVKINAATFNVTDGVGMLMRAGHTTIGKDVVIHLTNTGKVTAGKVGDANIDITTPSYLVMDVRSGYPGASAGFTITNNSAYELVEYK